MDNTSYQNVHEWSMEKYSPASSHILGPKAELHVGHIFNPEVHVQLQIDLQANLTHTFDLAQYAELEQWNA